MKKILILVLITSLFTFSCKNSVTNVLEGWWSIDYFVMNNHSYFDCLSVNTFFFEESTVKLPITRRDCIQDFDSLFPETKDVYYNGIWNWDKKSDSLKIKIESKNSLFNKDYYLKFTGNDQKKLLFLTLYNDSQVIVMRKGLYNYDANLKQIKELEELTR